MSLHAPTSIPVMAPVSASAPLPVPAPVSAPLPAPVSACVSESVYAGPRDRNSVKRKPNTHTDRNTAEEPEPVPVPVPVPAVIARSKGHLHILNTFIFPYHITSYHIISYHLISVTNLEISAFYIFNSRLLLHSPHLYQCLLPLFNSDLILLHSRVGTTPRIENVLILEGHRRTDRINAGTYIVHTICTFLSF